MLQFAFFKDLTGKYSLGHSTFIPENNKTTCFTIKIVLKKLETVFPGWSTSNFFFAASFLTPLFIHFSNTASCHWLSVNRFEWKIKPKRTNNFQCLTIYQKNFTKYGKVRWKSSRKPEAKAVQYILVKCNQISYLLMVHLSLQMLHRQILFRYEHHSTHF